MTNKVVFRTNTEIDIRSFTTFGINSKPNSNNPIGFFGTGLKYAVAVLAREGIPVTVWIGKTAYKFYTKEEEFRDKTFSFVYMRKGDKRKWFQKEYQLPFTTELGKTWKLWQVFRELYSNTLDELGDVFATDREMPSPDAEFAPNYTHIIVEGEAFLQELRDMPKTFLDVKNRECVAFANNVQVFVGESEYLYYRGMRVKDLPKPSLFTYNIIGAIDLTEDRTAKYDFQLENYLIGFMKECSNAFILEKTLQPPKDRYESGLDYKNNYTYNSPSDTFRGVVQILRRTRPDTLSMSANDLLVEEEKQAALISDFVPLRDRLASCVQEHDWSTFLALCRANRNELLKLLGVHPNDEEEDDEIRF